MDMEIRRGDVFFVHKGGEVGNEQYGGRPAVIVSNDKGNTHSGNVTVVYLTTQPKTELPTHTRVTTTREVSTALCEGITTISKDRLNNFCCALRDDEMERIDECIRIALALEGPLPFTPEPEEEPDQVLLSDLEVERVRLQTERDLYKELYLRHAGMM